MLVDTYIIDGQEYAIFDRVNKGDNSYCILVNVNDKSDFFVRKYKIVEGIEYVSKLEKEEFNEFKDVFYNRMQKILQKK